MAKTKRGVPPGYTHHWAYKGHWKETKGKKGIWKIDFKATKGKKAKTYGQFKKGFKIHWKINAHQIATKTGKGQYQTHLYGTKKRIHSGYKKQFTKTHKQLYK